MKYISISDWLIFLSEIRRAELASHYITQHRVKAVMSLKATINCSYKI